MPRTSGGVLGEALLGARVLEGRAVGRCVGLVLGAALGLSVGLSVATQAWLVKGERQPILQR